MPISQADSKFPLLSQLPINFLNTPLDVGHKLSINILDDLSIDPTVRTAQLLAFVVDF